MSKPTPCECIPDAPIKTLTGMPNGQLPLKHALILHLGGRVWLVARSEAGRHLEADYFESPPSRTYTQGLRAEGYYVDWDSIDELPY